MAVLQEELGALPMFNRRLRSVLRMRPKRALLNSVFSSIGLVNCAHRDTGDSGPSFAIWLCPTGCSVRKPCYLLFPTFGLAVALRHATVVAWPGAVVPHCTSMGKLVHHRLANRAGRPARDMLSLFLGRSSELDKGGIDIK